MCFVYVCVIEHAKNCCAVWSMKLIHVHVDVYAMYLQCLTELRVTQLTPHHVTEDPVTFDMLITGLFRQSHLIYHLVYSPMSCSAFDKVVVCSL